MYKRLLDLNLFAFAFFSLLLFKSFHSLGQCPTQIVSNSTCIPASIKTLGGAYRTEWKRNNIIVETRDAKWDSMPDQLVASYKLTGALYRQIASDAAGNIYIAFEGTSAEGFYGSIQKWTPGAESGTIVTGQIPGKVGNDYNGLYGAIRFFLHSSGDLYVSLGSLNAVVKYPAGSTTGVVVAGNNGAGSGNNQLNSPEGIFVDAAGNIYIADRSNHRIMRWAPGATTGTRVAGGNGQGSAANQFSNPWDVQVVGTNIYVADYSNYRIQRWPIGGTTGVTVAGGNGTGTAANQISGSYYFYVDRFNNVFCTGRVAGGFTVQRWAPGATSGTVVANTTSWRNCLFVDHVGDLIMWDEVNRQVIRHKLNSTAAFTASNAGTYTATTYGSQTCSQNTNSIDLIGNTGHEVTIRGQSSYCQGETGFFNASVTNPFAGSFETTWKRNGITDTVMNPGFGDYMPPNLSGTELISVHVKQLSNGCITQDSLLVNASLPTPPAGVLTSSSNCTPATLTYQFSTPISSLIWSVNTTSSIIQLPAFGSNFETLIKNPFQGAEPIFEDYNPRTYRINTAGEIFVLDSLYPRILKFMPGQSNYTVVIGSTDTGSSNTRLKDPRDFWMDTDGTIYVADFGNSRLMKFPAGSATGVPIVTGTAAHLIFIKQNWIYLGVNNSVFRCSKNGGLPIRVINNSLGSASNQLAANIGGIWVDNADNLYVADFGNHRIQRWPLFGNNGVTVAGGNGEGAGNNRLTYPKDLYLDGAGYLYTSTDYIVFDGVNELWTGRKLRKWFIGQDTGVVIADGLKPFLDNQGDLLYIMNRSVVKRTLIKQVDFSVTHDYFDKVISLSSVSAQNGCKVPESNITLSGGLAPAFSIKAAEEKPCEGTIASWDAVVTQPAGSPKIAWWIEGKIAGTENRFSSAALQNGDTLQCIVTNQVNTCFQKQNLPVNLRPKPVIGLKPSQPIGVPASIILETTNVLPQIQWKLNDQILDTTHNWKEYGRMVAGKSNVVGNRANIANATGIFVDSAGVFYTTDAWGVKKWMVGRDLSDHIIYFGNGPNDVVRFGDSLYVAGGGGVQYRWVVRRYTLIGNQPAVVAGRYGLEGAAISDSQLTSPRKIWIQKDRDLFVTDGTRTTLWPKTSTYCSVISDQYPNFPMGIVGDGNENIYVLTVYGNLYRHHLPTKSQQLLHSFGPLANDFDGLAMDPMGYLYVSGTKIGGDGLVWRYNPVTDESVVIAGNKGVGAALNQIQTIRDIGLDETGNLFVLDGTNNRVMMFPADSSKSRAITQPGIYTVTATGYNGCQTTDSIHIYTGAYIFNGSGTDWSNSSFWQGNSVPPPIVGDDFYIEVNPVGSECILDGNLRISNRSTLVVKPGKKLTVKGNIKIE